MSIASVVKQIIPFCKGERLQSNQEDFKKSKKSPCHFVTSLFKKEGLQDNYKLPIAKTILLSLLSHL
jgi:hypothetical protein